MNRDDLANITGAPERIKVKSADGRTLAVLRVDSLNRRVTGDAAERAWSRIRNSVTTCRPRAGGWTSTDGVVGTGPHGRRYRLLARPIDQPTELYMERDAVAEAAAMALKRMK